MKYRWRVGRIWGTVLYVHVSVVALIGLVAVNVVSLGHGSETIGYRLLLLVSLFASLVVHECGHSRVASSYGNSTLDITLLPVGSITRLEREPNDPREELAVALAGPAVNAALACWLLIVLLGSGVLDPASELSRGRGQFLTDLMWMNAGLALFNLIPAFPMDGGRVIRAAIWLRQSYAEATRRAALASCFVAAGMALLGLLYNAFLVLVALLIFTSGRAEARAALKLGSKQLGKASA